MAINTEYSRLLFKRSTVAGVVPTIPTGTTIDNTWLTTDIMVGEIFMNTADDRLWIRSDNGLQEIAVSGSSYNTYTTGATLAGSTIYFDRTDMASAYTVDLSSLVITGATGAFTGGTVTGDTIFTSGLTANTFNIQSVGVGTVAYNIGLDSNGNVIQGGISTFTGGTISGPTVISSTLTVTGDTTMADFSATTISILNSGATTRQYFDYSGNIVQSGVTNSAIIGGSGNTISSGLRNVIIAGVGISATTSDTLYVTNIVGAPCDLSFAFSDESTAITTGTSKLTIYAPYAMTITGVRASLSTSGSTLSEFDVNVNGVSIFSRRPTIDANEFITATAAAGAPTVSSATVAQDDKITIDIDQAGTGAKGAKIYILGKRNS